MRFHPQKLKGILFFYDSVFEIYRFQQGFISVLKRVLLVASKDIPKMSRADSTIRSTLWYATNGNIHRLYNKNNTQINIYAYYIDIYETHIYSDHEFLI